MNVCHSVVVLDYGRVICTGTAAEVRADPQVQAAYLGTVPSGCGRCLNHSWSSGECVPPTRKSR